MALPGNSELFDIMGHALSALVPAKNRPARDPAPRRTGTYFRDASDAFHGWEVTFDYTWCVDEDGAPVVEITAAVLHAEPDHYALKLSAFTDADLDVVRDEITEELAAQLEREAAEAATTKRELRQLARASAAYERIGREWPL